MASCFLVRGAYCVCWQVLLGDALAALLQQLETSFLRKGLAGNLLPGLELRDNVLRLDTRPAMPVYRPRLLIAGPDGCGQEQLARAVLATLSECAVLSATLCDLHSGTAASGEGLLWSVFSEALRSRRPSVVYLGDVRAWLEGAGPSLVSLLRGLLSSLPYDSTVLLLGYCCGAAHEVLTDDVKEIFGNSIEWMGPIKDPQVKRRVVELALRSFRDDEGVFERRVDALPAAPAAPAVPVPVPVRAPQDEENDEAMMVLEWKRVLRYGGERCSVLEG